MELITASNNWLNRPNDERFFSLEELAIQTSNDLRNSYEQNSYAGNLQVVINEDKIPILNNWGKLSHYSFTQLANKLDLPASVLTDKLPPHIAEDAMNYRLKQLDPDTEISMLLIDNDTNTTVRSITSTSYTRIWDAEVLSYAFKLRDSGWRTPPARPIDHRDPRNRPATEDDVLASARIGLNIDVGDMIGPAGIYRGDRDCFIFMINDQEQAEDPTGGSLMRGVFFYNSEVGAKSIGITTFVCQTVCGNHIVWGAEDILHRSYRHVGKVRKRAFNSLDQCFDLLEAKPNFDQYQSLMLKMQSYKLGTNQDDVVQNLYDQKIDVVLSKRLLHSSYLNAFKHPEDGNPNSLLGMTNAITRFSQSLPNADRRMLVDAAVGKIYNYSNKVLN